MNQTNNFNIMFLVFFIAIGALAENMNPTAKVMDLPAWQTKAAWDTGKSKLQVGQNGDYLVIGLKNLIPKENYHLALRNPMALPAGMELDFVAALSHIYELFLLPVIRDAKGNEYAFKPGVGTNKGCLLGGYFLDNALCHAGETQVRVEGLRRPNRHNYEALKEHAPKPQPPFQLTGLILRTPRTQKNAAKAKLYLRDFRLSDVDYKTSDLYYQFKSREQFGEINGAPTFSFADFNCFVGEKFIVDWDIRQDYAGQPFMAGGAELLMKASDSAYPLFLQLSRKKIEIPVTKPGLYWVRAKMRAFKSLEQKAPDRITTRDWRLYVIRGRNSSIPTAPPARIGSSMIRIAANRDSLIWGEDAPLDITVRCFDASGMSCQTVVSDSSGKDLFERKFSINSDDESLKVTPPNIPPGRHTLKVSILADGKVVDKESLPIGRKTSDKDKEPFQFPNGMANSKQLKSGPPLFQLDFHMEHDRKYAKTIKEAIPQLLPITNRFEFRCDWREIEKCPGIYDFGELDDMLACAQQNGAKIQLNLGMKPPEWIPSHYTKNQDGKIFGHETYLFHGARLNYYQSPVIRPAFLEFVRHAVAHYRNHPAVESYYLLIEHPGEASYKGWFEGFDKFTIGNFRQVLKEKYGTIEALNKAWSSQWSDFASITPVKPGEKASSQYWLDWITFRENSVLDFKCEVADIIRHYDPERMIMIYGEGDERLKKYDIMTANGGCRSPVRFAYGKMRSADRGQNQRAEEVSCTNWYAFYPTHIDTSLFTMLMGGGRQTSCKMFFPVRSLWRKDGLNWIRKNRGLERYEKFMPIWRELRHADVVYKDIRLYSNRDSFRVRRKSTFHPGEDRWANTAFLETQVPYWCAPGQDWMQSKMVVAFPGRLEYMKQRDMDELADYVRNGGVLLMGAGVGKTRIEDDAEYQMLKTLGFNAPAAEQPGCPFAVYSTDTKEKLGLLRYFLPHVLKDDEEIFATTEKGTPVITSRRFGKGTVYVFWAGSNNPVHDTRGAGIKKSYLREIALKHQISIPTQANSQFVYTNLLKDSRNGNWYLLLMRDNVERDGKTPTTTVKVKLPNGSYQATELINGKTNWRKSSSELLERGFDITLGEKEVAILKLEPQRNN